MSDRGHHSHYQADTLDRFVTHDREGDEHLMHECGIDAEAFLDSPAVGDIELSMHMLSSRSPRQWGHRA
jgi:hypothetical protein